MPVGYAHGPWVPSSGLQNYHSPKHLVATGPDLPSGWATGPFGAQSHLLLKDLAGSCGPSGKRQLSSSL